jgi:acyl dehydratase
MSAATSVGRGKYYEEFTVGEEFQSAARTVGEGMIDAFAGVTGDFSEVHTDAELMMPATISLRSPLSVQLSSSSARDARHDGGQLAGIDGLRHVHVVTGGQ